MPFVNPFLQFGVDTVQLGTGIIQRNASAIPATGSFVARLDAGAFFVPPIAFGAGFGSAGLGFDAGFAPAGVTGLTVSVNGVASIKRGFAICAGGYAEAKAALRLIVWEFAPDRRKLMRYSSAVTPVINIWASPLGWSQDTGGDGQFLAASIFRSVVPGRFYRWGIAAETSAASFAAGYALAAVNFIFDFPIAFFSFV